MKYIVILTLLCANIVFANELKIVADTFKADEVKGVSIFTGHVAIKKGHDELNASKVTIYTDKKNNPIKFIAKGNVFFKVQTQEGSKYEGSAGKVIYLPLEKEYNFYKNVHLKQIDEKKEILGDEITLNTLSGKAFAKGVNKEPVIMIFQIKDEDKK